MALFEFNRSFGPVPGVGQLSFEHAPGQICARDSLGNLVMRVATGPGFGQRLAAAFSDYRNSIQEADRQGQSPMDSADLPPRSASDMPTGYSA
jgi:hypothetical protein